MGHLPRNIEFVDTAEKQFHFNYSLIQNLVRPSPLIFMFLIDMVRQSRVGRSAKKKKAKKKNVGHNVQRHEIKAYKVQVYQELIQYLLFVKEFVN